MQWRPCALLRTNFPRHNRSVKSYSNFTWRNSGFEDFSQIHFPLKKHPFKDTPSYKTNLQPYRRKFEMGNDQGQFRAVVIGFDPIDIVSIPL